MVVLIQKDKKRIDMKFLKMSVVWFVLVCVSQTVLGQTTEAAAKSAQVRRLLEVTGTVDMVKTMLTATTPHIMSNIRSQAPGAPERAYQIVEREINLFISHKIDAPGGLIDRVIPIYTKYYSEEEIQKLIQFYETPLGQKTIALMPQVVKESVDLGRKWGEALSPELGAHLQKVLQREGFGPKKKMSY
jgi:hypothetical protein